MLPSFGGVIRVCLSGNMSTLIANRRRIVLLVLAAIIGCAAFVSFYLWQIHESREELLCAQDALQRHDLEAAAASLERYLQRAPDDANAWFLAARTARRRGNFEDARRFLEKCQKLGGITEHTRLEWDLLRVQSGDLRDIDVRLRALIGPSHPDALIVLEALAKGYFRSERLAEAHRACVMWIERQPDHPWPWLIRGRIHERSGKLDQAESDYCRAVANGPGDREARLAYGSLLLRQRKPDEAFEQFEQVLRRSHSDTDGLIGLAACRLEQGQPDSAIDLLDRFPSTSSAKTDLLRGKAEMQRADFARAETWLRQAIQGAPEDANSLYVLIQCLLAQGKKDEADRLAERLERLRADLNRLDELIHLVLHKPDSAQLRAEAGEVALRAGRPDEALRWLNSALLVKGDHRSTHAALANYYIQIGDASTAAEHRRRAMEP